MKNRKNRNAYRFITAGILVGVALTSLIVSAQGSSQTPITFSAFFSDPNANWNGMQDEVGKVITAKSGVTIAMGIDLPAYTVEISDIPSATRASLMSDLIM